MKYIKSFENRKREYKIGDYVKVKSFNKSITNKIYRLTEITHGFWCSLLEYNKYDDFINTKKYDLYKIYDLNHIPIADLMPVGRKKIEELEAISNANKYNL